MNRNNLAQKVEVHAVAGSLSSLVDQTAQQISNLDPVSSAQFMTSADSNVVALVLRTLSPDRADQIFENFSAEKKAEIENGLPIEVRNQWRLNRSFSDGAIGRMMEPVQAVFPLEMTVAETIEVLRELVKREFITYGYVVDSSKKLIGVLVMRELLFADRNSTLRDIILRDPFSLKGDMALMDAMKEVLTKHFPLYPVVNDDGHLIGQIRGHRLFEAQAFEISAQAGSMVGVEKEEKLSTPWFRSFKYRHPWLQLNLLTAFVAGAVVSIFQETIDQVVVLASFLPVLAGQSGNTGCQALAVTLRGMTLGELGQHGIKKLLIKEGLLGALNGALVGVSAGVGMYFLANHQGNSQALALSIIVFCAMICSCMVSGLSGALVPLVLKRLGADPATASSIFLTTATDVASMGMLLFLASRVLM